MNSLRSGTIALAVAVVFFAASGPLFAQTKAMSIEEFVGRRDKWKELQGVPLRLEGRYGVIGDTSMGFIKCELPFVVTRELARNRGDSNVVEVTGRMTTKDDKLLFQVESLSPRLSDLKTLQEMRYKIDSAEAAEWYRLAVWARQRGTFYKDDKLLEQARELDEQGVITEFRAMNRNDAEGLAELLKKARSINVAEEWLQQIVHEWLRSRWALLQSQPYAGVSYRDLAVEISQQLPGAMGRLDSFPEKQAEQYAANPKKIYEFADSKVRQTLHRLFYLEVMTARILHDIRADDSVGFQIVDRLKEDAPERTDLIQRYEDLAGKNQLARVRVMTQAQMQELAKRFEQDAHADLARQAKQNWLLEREPSLRKEGAAGLAKLAELRLMLFNDAEGARQLYVEAWHVDPTDVPAQEWLVNHGYRLVGDVWLLEAEIHVPQKSATDLAVEQGVVEVGMTAAQARAAQAVIPISITRIASSREVTEIWVYDTLIIRLSRPLNAEETRVVAVEQIRQPAAKVRDNRKGR